MSIQSPSAAPVTRILFLAANPDSTTPLHAGREVRRIRERLAITAHRSAIEIVERWAVRPGDLQQALIDIQPHIVHFSGHGTTEYELMLEGEDGSPQLVGKGVLAELFRLRGDGVRAVVLSACHSLPQAEAIAEHVDCAIGMRRAIGSEAAAEFSAALYHAIGSGDSIRRAFESARLHLEVTGIPEHRTPHLVVRRDGVNIERSLVREPPSATLPHEQILRLHAAAVSSRLLSSRAALLGGIDPAFVDSLPICANESSQILSDLHGLNAAQRPGNGAAPLNIWLGNALALAGEGPPADVFRGALSAISATEAPEAIPRPGALRAGDPITDELSKIGRAALLAGDHELSRSLYDVEALLARSPHHSEAQMLRDRIKRAIAINSTSVHSSRSHRGVLWDDEPLSSRAAPIESTGRERELRELTNELGRAGALICGLGGMGKTFLARVFLQTIAPDYPDLQITIDLQGTSREPLTPAAAMTHVVRAFLPGVPLPSDPEEIAGLYRAVLEGQRALILLEDAENQAQVEPLLPPDGSVLLITSRRRFALPNVHVLSLDRLESTDAVTLLQRLAPTLDGATASKLAEVCGGVPLALRLAGCALRNRPSLTPEVYIDRLLDAQSHHELLDAAFRVSLGLLDPILQMLWFHLGSFTSSFKVLDALQDSSALFAVEDMRDLVGHGMLEHDPGTDLYNVPRSGRCLAMSHRAEVDLAELGRTEPKEARRSHDRLGSGNRAGRASLGLEGALSVARRVGHRPAEALYLERMAKRLGNSPSAARPAEQALLIYRELGDRAGESRMLGRLFEVHKDSQNDQRAVELGEQALVILRELGDHSEESRMLSKVGEINEHLKNARRALTFQEQCLVAAREVGSLRDQARITLKISEIYQRLGEMDNAIAALQMCVDLTRTFDRSSAESLAAELETLRASRAR